jgi:hypothetical protein
MTSGSTERTPREERAQLRADFARILRRSLDRHDVTQAQLADLCGVAPCKAGRWCDHTSSEVPGAADVAMFPVAVARDVMTWIGSHVHMTVSDDLAFDVVADHLAHLHTIIREGGDVVTSYSRIVASGHTPAPADRRELIREIEESIRAQQALLNDLRADEAAHSINVQRRPSEPAMRRVS